MKILEMIVASIVLKEDFTMEEQSAKGTKLPSQLIDERIEELGDWRGQMLSKVRNLIKEADPEVVEELKWRGNPVWSLDGMFSHCLE